MNETYPQPQPIKKHKPGIIRRVLQAIILYSILIALVGSAIVVFAPLIPAMLLLTFICWVFKDSNPKQR